MSCCAISISTLSKGKSCWWTHITTANAAVRKWAAVCWKRRAKAGVNIYTIMKGRRKPSDIIYIYIKR
jgi:hypothetical protein